MPAYSDLYLSEICRTQGHVFYNIREALPGVDEQWFIEAYMRSHVRHMLDQASPRFAAMPSYELIDWFIENEQNGEYKRGAEWGGFLPQWAGHIYARYQWRYDVPSAALLELLPLTEISRVYPALHQAGWDVAVEKIHEILTGQSSS